MSIKPILSSVALAATALLCTPASAATNSLTFQGVTFEMSVLDADTFNLTILDADAATGDWTGVNFIRSIAIKDIGSFSGASIASGPGTWSYAAVEMDSSGCKFGSPTSASKVCFGAGAPVALTSNMSWNIDVTGGSLADFASSPPHLKLNFLVSATQERKTGSNLSQEVPAIPEPETYALMLAGLAAVGFVARRRKTA